MMGRRRSKGLTDRQRRILEVLDSFFKQNGYPPSIREICKRAVSLDFGSQLHSQLEEMGYIERDETLCAWHPFDQAVGRDHGRGLAQAGRSIHAPEQWMILLRAADEPSLPAPCPSALGLQLLTPRLRGCGPLDAAVRKRRWAVCAGSAGIR
jgi:hypothetical protein